MSSRVGRIRASDEHGAVWVLVAVVLPVLILFATLAIDVAHWWDYKRNLQARADAMTLAAGGVYSNTCAFSSPPTSGTDLIGKTAQYYSGADATSDLPYTPYPSLPALPAGSTTPYKNIPNLTRGSLADYHIRLNATNYADRGGTNFSMGSFCNATDENGQTGAMVDTKITQSNIPLFFKSLGLFGSVNVSAHARVAIKRQTSLRGSLPFAVPDLIPQFVWATFTDRSTGLPLTGCANGCTFKLDRLGTKDATTGADLWSHALAGVPISASEIGVNLRIIEGSNDAAACGTSLVTCVSGVVFARGWTDGNATTGPPVLKDVNLGNGGSCSPDPYFSNTPCSPGLSAVVDFGDRDITDNKTKVTATVDGRSYDLTKPATGSVWTLAPGTIRVSTAPGAHDISLDWTWEQGNGTTWRTLTCTNANSNPCKGSGTFAGVAQSFFVSDTTVSATVRKVAIGEGALLVGANSFQRGTNHDLTLTVGVGGLANASAFSDPTVILHFSSASGSLNFGIDCGGSSGQTFREQLLYGCAQEYSLNSSLQCPDTTIPLPPNPTCADVVTGDKLGILRQSMSERFDCHPNNWQSTDPTKLPVIPAGDPRLVPLMITTWGAFSGSGGSTRVPVAAFAGFYITGYDGSGPDPCAGVDRNQAYPDAPAQPHGDVWGHFMVYTAPPGSGGASDDPCDYASLGTCLAILTR